MIQSEVSMQHIASATAIRFSSK